MTIPQSLQVLLDRLKDDNPNQADLMALRHALLDGQITLASDNRSISISGNVQDATLIIGSNNFVLQGANAERILELLRAEQERIDADRYVSALQNYLRALHNYCNNLPYLTLHDIRSSISLDETYVPIKLTPRRWEQTMPEQSGEDHVHSIADVLRKNDPKHLLLIGEPGAGKSSLLRQIAEHAWHAPQRVGLDMQHLPLLLSLRSLALHDESLEGLIRKTLASSEIMIIQSFPDGFFQAWAEQENARWLFLLDGLDEVPADKRPSLMARLRNLLKQVGDNRVIITSRPSGYTQGEFNENQFGQYEISAFTTEQTGEFARYWFGEHAADFLKSLDTVRGGGLQGTPLLLTIAAKIYLERTRENGKGSLPERRSNLYNDFVDIWLNEARLRGMREDLGAELDDIALHTLSYLAWEMSNQPALLSENELAMKVADFLKKESNPGNARAETLGLRFVQVMGRYSGIFLLRGKTYDWLHPTFREYLTARHVMNTSRSDMDKIWKEIVSHWWSDGWQTWREITSFILGILSEKGHDVTVLIEYMYKEHHDEGTRLGAQALAEQARIEPLMATNIIDQLLKRIRGQWRGDWSVQLLGELQAYPQARDGLLALIYDDDDKLADGSVREEAIKSLGKFGCVDDLLTLARNTQMYEWMRDSAATVLGDGGWKNESAQAWLVLAQDKQVSADRRVDAAKALGELGRTSVAAPILMKLLLDEKIEGYSRSRAIKALGHQGREDDLLVLVQDANLEASERVYAAKELQKMGRADEVVPILIDLARNVQISSYVRISAAKILCKQGSMEEAVPVLLELVQDAELEERERFDIPKFLETWGRTQDAIQACLLLVYDEELEGWARHLAAEKLVKLEQVEKLLQVIYDGRLSAHLRAVIAGELVRSNTSTETGLLLARDEKMEPQVRLWAVLALMQGDHELKDVDEVISIMLTIALDKQVIASVRAIAAEVLVYHEHTDVGISVLMELARDDAMDTEVRVEAVSALGRLEKVEEITQILLTLVQTSRLELPVLERVVDLMGYYGNEGCLPYLNNLELQDSNEDIQKAVKRAIQNIHWR